MNNAVYEEVGYVFDQIIPRLETEQGLDEISELLENVNFCETESEVYLAYLNYSCCRNNEIREWDNFVLKVKSDLIKRGYDPKEVLPNV